jgi:hypothetical protein
MDFSSFPQNLGFLVHPKSEGKSLDLEKNHFWEFVPCVEVTLVSKFHSIWSIIVKNPSWEERGGFWEKITFSRYLLPDNVRHGLDKIRPLVLSSRSSQSDNVRLDRTMSDWDFQPDVCIRFWSYLANWVSNWSHSFSAAFVTSMGSFLRCWLVYSSPYCRVLALGVELRT